MGTIFEFYGSRTLPYAHQHLGLDEPSVIWQESRPPFLGFRGHSSHTVVIKVCRIVVEENGGVQSPPLFRRCLIQSQRFDKTFRYLNNLGESLETLYHIHTMRERAERS